MDTEKVAKAIVYLRKRAGYTQRELAERLGVSDKAVSKWERGLSLPDVSLLGKISILLDTDTDSLLSGDVIHHDSGWHGLLVLTENPCQIGAYTVIYDKPLVYYLLSYFFLVGVKRIKILCSEEDKTAIQRDLAGEEGFDVSLSFCSSLHEAAIDPAFMSCSNLMVVFGRSVMYSVDMTRFFQRAMLQRDHLTILAQPKGTRDPSSMIRFDANKKIVEGKKEDPIKTQYDYCDLPVLFCPREMFAATYAPEDQDSDVSRIFSGRDVYIEALDRGFVEIRADSWDRVAEASTFVRIVQEHCGMIVYCLEEVAWRRGLMSADCVRTRGEQRAATDYGEYILRFCVPNG